MPRDQVVGVMNKDPRTQPEPGLFCEGPARDAQGNLVSSPRQTPNRQIWKVSTSGTGAVFGGSAIYTSNGTEFDAQGRLTVCQKGAIADLRGGAATRTVLADPGCSHLRQRSHHGSNGCDVLLQLRGSQVFHRSAGGPGHHLRRPDFHRATASNGWRSGRSSTSVPGRPGSRSGSTTWPMTASCPTGRTSPPSPSRTGSPWTRRVTSTWPPGTTAGSTSSTLRASRSGRCTVQERQHRRRQPERQHVQLRHRCPTRSCIITGDGGLYSVQLKVGPRKQSGPVGLRAALRFDPRGLSLSSGAFNPGYQSLSIALPVAGGRFSVRIYDVRMREVWHAAAGDAAGFAALEWNGASASGEPLPSGRYFILAQGAGSRKPCPPRWTSSAADHLRPPLSVTAAPAGGAPRARCYISRGEQAHPLRRPGRLRRQGGRPQGHRRGASRPLSRRLLQGPAGQPDRQPRALPAHPCGRGRHQVHPGLSPLEGDRRRRASSAGVAQDALVMNIDDLGCVGSFGPYLLSNTIGRNAKLVPGEVIAEIIAGYRDCIATLARTGHPGRQRRRRDRRPGRHRAHLGGGLHRGGPRPPRRHPRPAIASGPAWPSWASAPAARPPTRRRRIPASAATATPCCATSSCPPITSATYPEVFAPEIAALAYTGRFRLSDPFPGVRCRAAA